MKSITKIALLVLLLTTTLCLEKGNYGKGDQVQQSLVINLQVAFHAGVGYYLVDGNGMSLYHFHPEHIGPGWRFQDIAIRCYGQCAMDWPPLIANSGTAIIAGNGLYQSRVSRRLRQDGNLQATYNNIPLYHFDEDMQPGDIKGHKLFANGGLWFLIGPNGRPIYH